MSRLEANVEISKTPDEVFAYVIDPMHTSQWMHAMFAVSSLSSDPVEVGSTFHHCWQWLDRLLDTIKAKMARQLQLTVEGTAIS